MWQIAKTEIILTLFGAVILLDSLPVCFIIAASIFLTNIWLDSEEKN